MTYARFDDANSDVYVYLGDTQYVCSGCLFHEEDNATFEETADLIDHLFAHLGAGDQVPQDTFDRLTRDQEANDHQIVTNTREHN